MTAMDPALLLGRTDTFAAAKAKANTPAARAEKARAAAEDFESVFLNSMFQTMFAGVEGEGPMGGDKTSGVWRSMLTDEFAKSTAKAGGIGIADQVFRTLLAQQEMTG